MVGARERQGSLGMLRWSNALLALLCAASCDGCQPPSPLTPCDSDPQCPRGYQCRAKDHVCIPHCDHNADCDDLDPCNGVETCAVDQHRCLVISASAPDQFDGTACGAGRECRGGLCIARNAACVADLSASGDHTCAATAGGEVDCWGRNARGQLGLGDTLNRLAPTTIPALGDVLEVNLGHEFSCARRASDVQCWGDNRYGQLGDGSLTQRATPGPVADLDAAVEVAAGLEFACARLAAGGVACWGRNDVAPMLGNGDRSNQSRPARIDGLDDAIALGAGSYHACAIRADRTLWCWGANWWGQLGTGCGDFECAQPVQVEGLDAVLAVSAGEEHTCALLVDGSIRCLGGGGRGQLGTSNAVDSATPLVVAGLDRAVAIAAGQYFNCARLSGGDVACWGTNQEGQLGDGSHLTRGQPRSVTLPAPALDLASATSHACARLDDDTVHCWGDNSWGQIGDGHQSIETSPKAVLLSAGVEQIAVGYNHSCALTVADAGGQRHVLCWGNNQYGQLGDTANGGSTPPPDSDRPVAIAVDIDAAEIAASGFHSCARTAAGEAYCWGDNSTSQLGTGDDVNRSAPTRVLPGETIAQLALGFDYTCALTTDGRVLCWGANDQQQIQGSGPLQLAQPIQVIDDVAEVDARVWYTCARRNDGSVWCWGAIGQMWLTHQPPLQVDLSAIAQPPQHLAVGGDHVCLLDADGHAWCWGRNSLGALGVPVAEQGDTFDPVAVRAPAQHEVFAGLASSWNNSCAIEPLPAGGILCWGANDVGELGVGDTRSCETPTAVVGLSGAIAVAAGESHTCAINSSHNAFCWGSYSYGQLGDDRSADTWLPTEVTALRCR